LPRERIAAFVDRAYASLAEVDYYRVLGVSSGANAEQIRAAYYRLATYLHPDIHGPDLDPAFRRKLTAVYSRVVEAYKVLTDEVRRGAYDAALAGGSMRLRSGRTTAPAPRPEDQIQNAKARRFFELSRAALRDHDLKSARTNLKLALMMEPGSPLLERELAKLDPPGS
jgi:DnaJ-class molecular chaperone